MFLKIFSILLLPLAILTYSIHSANLQKSTRLLEKVGNIKSPDDPPQPEQSYPDFLQAIQAKQAELSAGFQSASPAKKREIRQQARAYIEQTLPQLARYWIGTPWDFNGTSQTPREGKIACGYFVSVVLRDMGFKVSRISLAQQASQRIITTMIKSGDKEILKHKLNYDTFVKRFREKPDGIYIIGLDTHVGFLTNFDNKVRFFHSGPSGVVEETPAQAYEIKVSKYRVIGNLTLRDYVIDKWLSGVEFPTDKP